MTNASRHGRYSKRTGRLAKVEKGLRDSVKMAKEFSLEAERLALENTKLRVLSKGLLEEKMETNVIVEYIRKDIEDLQEKYDESREENQELREKLILAQSKHIDLLDDMDKMKKNTESAYEDMSLEQLKQALQECKDEKKELGDEVCVDYEIAEIKKFMKKKKKSDAMNELEKENTKLKEHIKVLEENYSHSHMKELEEELEETKEMLEAYVDEWDKMRKPRIY